jgi:thiol-disulfide isomerase/thioredoxin
MNTSRFWIVCAGAAVLLGLTVVARSLNMNAPASTDRVDLSLQFEEVDGTPVRLSKFEGKPLIINLWGTWCAPCRLEMPQLNELAAKYGDRVTIVGISVDDGPEDIRAFVKEFGVTYPILAGLDHADSLEALGYYGGVPMSIFVRADGTVSHRLMGIATTAAWERRIEALF